jgi:trimeric autotransporter adhesin
VPRASSLTRWGHRRAVLVGVIVAALLCLGGAAWASTNGGASGFRTATVAPESIAESLTVVGTVEPVSDAAADFQVGGEVATVSATQGEQVSAGEALATLDTTSLSESVSSAESTLQSDEAKLTEDETAETSSSSTGSTSTGSTSTPTASASTTTSTTATTSTQQGTSDATIEADQTTLTKDESTTSSDQQQEAADLAAAEQACGVDSTSGTSSSTTTTTAPSTSTTTTTPTSDEACVSALNQVSKDEQAVTSDQSQVGKDESALSQALSQSSSTTGTAAGSTSSSSAGTGSTASSTTPSNATTSTTTADTSSTSSTSSDSAAGGSSAASTTPSAKQIALDQSDIDTANANLIEAQQSLADATLTSPIAGTVVAVDIATGETVTAGSSTAVITVVGTKSFEVTGTLSTSEVPSVKVGDKSTVAVDGVNGSIKGTVAQVGPPASSTDGYDYPVVVVLPTTATELFAGSSANVVIETAAVANVLAVPTSAVQTSGKHSYIDVLAAGVERRQPVKVGMIGDVYTQVLSGLTRGETVILANYAEAVPSSNVDTLSTGGGTFGGAGTGGSTFAGAGAGGGPRGAAGGPGG